MAQEFPLIKRKIRVPQRRRSQIRRQRLLDYLYANIQQKLILVAAGAGYGKTSLLIEFAHDSDLPICWYSLDASDNHTLNFVEYLTAAIRQRFPQFGDSILSFLRQYQGPSENIEPFIRLFISEIEDHTDDYFVLVLDDFHEVIESEPVNALLDGLLRYLPEHCHLILASRGVPRRLTLTRLASRGQVSGLGVEHLAFTTKEIAAVLRELGYDNVSEEQLDEIAKRSQGWITSILLAAQRNGDSVGHELAALTGASGGVFDFMAEQVLTEQPLDIQTFMLESALLEEMTSPLCNALLGTSDAARRLPDLAARNLFIFPLDAEGNAFQYHQLFREFLVAKLEQDRPERYRELCLTKAGLLVHEGQWPQAIESFMAIRAHQQAAEAIEIAAQDTYNTGHWSRLASWIDALPPDVCQEHPRLLFFRAKVAIDTGALEDASLLLDKAHDLYTKREDELGAARVLVQQGVVQRLRGRTTEAIGFCEAALQRAGGRDHLVATQAHHNIGLAYALQGEYGPAVDGLQRALQCAEANGDDTNAAFIANDLATSEMNRGRLLAARKSFHQALLSWRRIGNPNGLAIALQGLGMVHHYLGRYAEAENRFLESLEKSLQMNDKRVAAYTKASYGDLLRDTGRYDRALKAYQEAHEMATATHTTSLLIYVLASSSIAHRFKGALADARRVLTEALDQTDPARMLYETGLCYLSEGILAYDREELDKAQQSLEQALERFVSVESVRDQGRAHLYLAALSLRRQDAATARQSLTSVSECIKHLGSCQFIVGEGPDVLPLLRSAQEYGLDGLDYTRIHADLAQLYPDASLAPFVQLVSTSVPLEFMALDGGRILRNGKAVGGWESAAARVMAFLLAEYPQGLRRDKIIDTLWPEINLSRGNSQFHSTLYRLRRVLSKEAVICEDNLYRINPDWESRYDVSEFEHLSSRGQGDDRAAHLARVQGIALCHTPFFEACEGEWCDQMRRALETELVELMIREARYQAQQAAIDTAEGLYLRTLGVDSLDERAHRGLMWCKNRRNDRAGALRQYQSCVRLLENEIGVTPSPETTQLYQAIRDSLAAPPLL